MSDRPLVWIPRPVHDDAVAVLARHVDVVGGDVPFAEVADRVAGVLLRTVSVDGDMIRAAPRLAVVARHGAGLDTVDTTAAAEQGVVVTTTASANSRSVAEHAMGLLLAVRRRIGLAAKDPATPREALTGTELAGSTLGLLGFGRIAAAVAAIAGAGFGMRVLAHDPVLDGDTVRAAGVEPVGIDELLARSATLSLHAPLTDATRGVLGARALAALPDGAVVVNTARGGLVDETALLAALDDGRLGGAGLDVTAVEPLATDDPLRSHPRVVLTPHIGGQTREAMRRVATDAAESILAEFRRRELIAGV